MINKKFFMPVVVMGGLLMAGNCSGMYGQQDRQGNYTGGTPGGVSMRQQYNPGDGNSESNAPIYASNYPPQYGGYPLYGQPLQQEKYVVCEANRGINIFLTYLQTDKTTFTEEQKRVLALITTYNKSITPAELDELKNIKSTDVRQALMSDVMSGLKFRVEKQNVNDALLDGVQAAGTVLYDSLPQMALGMTIATVGNAVNFENVVGGSIAATVFGPVVLPFFVLPLWALSEGFSAVKALVPKCTLPVTLCAWSLVNGFPVLAVRNQGVVGIGGVVITTLVLCKALYNASIASYRKYYSGTQEYTLGDFFKQNNVDYFI